MLRIATEQHDNSGVFNHLITCTAPFAVFNRYFINVLFYDHKVAFNFKYSRFNVTIVLSIVHA